jgi:hypothetical protein
LDGSEAFAETEKERGLGPPLLFFTLFSFFEFP